MFFSASPGNHILISFLILCSVAAWHHLAQRKANYYQRWACSTHSLGSILDHVSEKRRQESPFAPEILPGKEKFCSSLSRLVFAGLVVATPRERLHEGITGSAAPTVSPAWTPLWLWCLSFGTIDFSWRHTVRKWLSWKVPHRLQLQVHFDILDKSSLW